MNFQIPLTTQQQADLERQAAALGMDLSSFIQNLIRERLDVEPPQPVPPEMWRREFDAWIASQVSRNPQFDDSRESIYD